MKLKTFQSTGSGSFYEYPPMCPAGRAARYPWSPVCYRINLSTHPKLSILYN